MSRPTLAELEATARAALSEYGIAEAELHLLRRYNNATYRVVAAAGAEYVLRVTSNYYGEAELRSEMEWLSAMQGERDVRFPCPVRALSGGLVVHGRAEGSAESRLCVLCAWIPGEQRAESILDANDLSRLGRATALFHRRSAAFTPPPDFARPRWDESRFLDPGVTDLYERGIAFLRDYLSGAELERVRAMAEDLCETMRARRTDRASHGLVHGDFHAGNFLFRDATIGFIDFEDLGWGYYLQDVATALFGMLERTEYPSLADAFSRAYGEVFALPPTFERDLPAFQLFRALFLTTLAVTRDSAERAWWEGYALGKLRRLLETPPR